MDSCDICGRVPAERFVIRKHIGMIVLQRFHKVDNILCKTCCTTIAKDWTKTTAFLGWWGFISFFVTPLNLLANLGVLRRAKRMSEPMPP